MPAILATGAVAMAYMQEQLHQRHYVGPPATPGLTLRAPAGALEVSNGSEITNLARHTIQHSEPPLPLARAETMMQERLEELIAAMRDFGMVESFGADLHQVVSRPNPASLPSL